MVICLDYKVKKWIRILVKMGKFNFKMKFICLWFMSFFILKLLYYYYRYGGNVLYYSGVEVLCLL